MSDAREQVASLVSTLAVRFAQRTLAELPGMREACAQLSQREAESLSQLKRWAHKVRGTAASIGLGGISARAGEVEDLLSSAAISSTVASVGNRLIALLADLEADLRLAAGDRK